MKYWEDFKLGERAELGRHTFTEAEIKAALDDCRAPNTSAAAVLY